MNKLTMLIIAIFAMFVLIIGILFSTPKTPANASGTQVTEKKSGPTPKPIPTTLPASVQKETMDKVLETIGGMDDKECAKRYLAYLKNKQLVLKIGTEADYLATEPGKNGAPITLHINPVMFDPAKNRDQDELYGSFMHEEVHIADYKNGFIINDAYGLWDSEMRAYGVLFEYMKSKNKLHILIKRAKLENLTDEREILINYVYQALSVSTQYGSNQETWKQIAMNELQALKNK